LGPGPRVVAIGGGTGLSGLLRGLKAFTDELTAVVTVADDGGSSGRLRRELGILPPGDFRQCLVALANVEPLMKELLQYRFTAGETLEGHSFGNLFLAALIAITGSFEGAIRESSRVLAVRGRVLPSTLGNIVLGAEFEDGSVVIGESAIPGARKRVRRLFLRPEHPAAYPEAVAAILTADLIVIGPGSLFTSVLPNLLVEGISRAVRQARAVKVLVCNVATEAGETDRFSLADHVAAIEAQVGCDLFTYVLANDNFQVDLPDGVLVRPAAGLSNRYRLVAADVVDTDDPWRHDPGKLARALLTLYYEARRRDSSRRLRRSV
jgi:uncharacterized cofD-like protein